jgi:hypothetical protein
MFKNGCGKVLGGESLSTPYHIYNGAIAFIGGTADTKVAAELLRKERLTPLVDADGQALMAIWVRSGCAISLRRISAHIMSYNCRCLLRSSQIPR